MLDPHYIKCSLNGYFVLTTPVSRNDVITYLTLFAYKPNLPDLNIVNWVTMSNELDGSRINSNTTLRAMSDFKGLTLHSDGIFRNSRAQPMDAYTLQLARSRHDRTKPPSRRVLTRV